MNRTVLLLLIFTSSFGFAAETKRPSWSQGLPEQKRLPTTFTTTIDKQMLSLEDSEHAQSEPEIKIESDTFKTDVMLPLEITPVEQIPTLSQHAVNQENEQLNQSTTQVATEDRPNNLTVETYSNEIESSNNSPNGGLYSWNITRQFPIKVSSATINNRNSLLIKVMIDNRGNIVTVDRVLEDTPENLMRVVARSLKRWKFAAPEEEGIVTPLLSRVFKVALTPR